MSHTCSNGRSLLISNMKAVESDLEDSRLAPCVVMITAWAMQSISMMLWKPLIELLLSKGCSHIVCVGSYAEQLHDLIDEIVIDGEAHIKGFPFDIVLTTYHDDETAEEVAEFFTATTDVWNKENGGLVAVLGDQDGDIRKFLLKMISRTGTVGG